LAISTMKSLGRIYDVYDGDEIVPGTLLGTQVGGSDIFYGYGPAYGYIAYGDSYEMGARTKGGSDSFYGGDDVGSGFGADSMFGNGVEFAGDAYQMFGGALGGNDYMYGGTNSNNVFGGDAAQSMYEKSRGGNDFMQGGDTRAYWETGSISTMNMIYGDGYVMGGAARGGRDTIAGGTVYADGYSANGTGVFLGDGYVMGDNAMGGADRITGADAYTYAGSAEAVNYLVGDAVYQSGLSTFGNDVLLGGSAYVDGASEGSAEIVNYMIGDAATAAGAVKFGSDKLTGGNGSGDGFSVNLMYGDIVQAGDVESGALSVGALLSDAMAAAGIVGVEALGALALPDLGISVAGAHTAMVFGNDILTGGQFATNIMYGDSSRLSGGDRAGNDILIAGSDSDNIMFGDAGTIEAGAFGGKDRLVSGTGNDVMFGDASSNAGTGGADVFVFAPGNGSDVVADFQVNVDRIDLTAFAASHLVRTFRAFVASGRVQDTEVGVVLHLDADPASESNTVLLAGVHLDGLSGSSFIL